jgi:hypothetical protein
LVVHTLTVDNGMEFASHKHLTELIGAPVYFAHEHSPWERGANEQTNKLIRYFMPKGIDLAGYSAADASLVETLLNERPRKCLDYLSPEQSMRQASLHLEWQSAGLEKVPRKNSRDWKLSGRKVPALGKRKLEASLPHSIRSRGWKPRLPLGAGDA